ncbi:hypothetical protein B4U80_02280 [Leptotrombidium deliense]|uniref:Fatty acyl-CoA reductase n=1 Tax=Leptotrombidium deliense TaxID=299467 RepID=A0A443SD40_9ACAR|nr:hypothetical protein B4U80_02280 [Leptotrombidium deliense]
MKNIPTAIIRPPIVTPSIEEPVPGWVDTLNGPAGLLMAASIGVLRTSDWRYDIEPDGMPVDLISNAILSIGWYISLQSKPLGIYNITWRNLNRSFDYPDGHILFKLAIDAYLKAPYSLAFRPVFQPERINLKSKVRYALEKFFYHFIIAFLIDTFISCFGYKRMLVNYVKRMHYALDIMKYFGTRQWVIKVDNTLQVLDAMTELDRKLFEFDGRSYTDQSYIADVFWMGARRYLLKDDDSTIPVAKVKYLM